MIKKVKIRFIRSYLLVMLVVVLILSVLASFSLRMVGEDLEHKNELILDYVKNSLDKALGEVNLLSYEITGNPWLISHEGEEMSMVEAVRITRYLDMLDSANSIIRDIAIYFPEHNLVVNDVGRFLPRHYYMLYCPYTQTGVEEWTGQLGKVHSLEWQLNRIRKMDDQGEFQITLLHTLNRNVPEGESPLLMITLDSAEMEFMMRNNNMDNSEMFALLTEKGETIDATGNRDMLATLSVSWHENARGRVISSDPSLVVSEAGSNYLGIRYVSVSQRTSFEGALHLVRILLTIGTVAAVGIGVLCAVWLTRKNVQPLQNLSEVIRGTDGGQDDIYDAIGENIRRLTRENSSVHARMEKQRSVLRTMFVASLLRGEITGERQFIDHCTGCGIDFKDMLHCAFVLYIRTVPTQIGDSEGGDDLLLTLLESSVRHMRGHDGCDAEIVHMDGFYTGWMMLPDAPDAADRCREYADALTEYIYKTYSVKAIAVCGGIRESFQQIPDSRDEAMQMLNTVILQNMTDNLTWRDVESGFGKAVRGNMDIYGAFVNCLRVQDFSGAGKLREKLLQEYLNVYLPRQVYVLRKQTVLSVMLDALEQTAQTESDAEAAAECRGVLKAADLPDEFAVAMKNALSVLEAMQSRGQKESSRKNVEQLREYIDRNFANPDMGLALLSQEFSMSSAYLSRVIKAELGAGILDYVNKRRVEEARRLLKETNMTVKQIAEAVGYISDITFIRVFKQYEGTTPGKYRGMVEKNAKTDASED